MENPIESTGIAALGLDAKALLFQVVNFLLLLVVLRVFAYKPILQTLERRRKTIEESLEKAKAIEESELKLREKIGATLKKTQDQAQKTLAQAKQTGESIKSQLIEQGKVQQQKLVDETAAQLAFEKERMISGAKKELIGLVAAATAKVIEIKLDEAKNNDFVTKTLKELS